MRLGRMRGAMGVVLLGLLATPACGKSRGNPAKRVPDDAPVAGHDGGAVVAGGGGTGQAGTATTVSGTGGTIALPPQGDAGMGGDAPVVGNPVAPIYPGYTLIIDEHFDVPLDLNADPIWTWSDGGMLEGQVRFVEEAISFGDGLMKITTDEPNEPVPAGSSFAENDEVASKRLTSGELRTKFNNYRYGRYEARIKAPTPVPGSRDKGNFITKFFTTRTPFQEEYYEATCEIVGGKPDGLLTNVVFWIEGKDSSDNRQNHAVQHDLDPSFAQGFDSSVFHTYAFVWRAGSISWYVDDELKAIRDYTPQSGNGTPVPDLTAKIMLNTWIFNASYAYGGELGDANVYPFTTEVDFIRFYKQDDESYPCAEPPSCLEPEDLNASKNNPNEADTEG